MNDKQKLEKIILHYGVTEQTRQAIEELNELAVAINKVHRAGTNTREKLFNVMEEIADVEIMLEQIKIIFGIAQKDIEDIKHVKIGRTERNINR